MPGDDPRKRGVPRPLSGGPVRFGPYMLESRVAVGGTAEVYLAHPLDKAAEPKRLIVKRLLPHFVADPDGRTMFEREAALHTAVRHKNVVVVYGSGLVEGEEPYLAMEYVEGVDCYRLLRRLSQEGDKLPVPLAAFIAREVLRGLESVHSARDDRGAPLGIIHRDVTPSNIYLSLRGEVKLGDFGIARSTSRATLKNAASAMLKGKFAYLAPEQVAGEAFDHRADLFSMGVVLAEMVLGKPLFAGSGQLAVLLSIRDCRIDPLLEARAKMPEGMIDVFQTALAREPANRFQTAADFASALKPFAPPDATATAKLGELVRFAQSKPSSRAMQAVRDSAAAVRVARPAQPDVPPPAAASVTTDPESAARPSERTTGEYTAIPSYVETASGQRFGPWTFARLVESLATGQVTRGDMVDYMGRGMAPVEEVDDLARFLPARSVTTNEVPGLGPPDYTDEVTPNALLAVMLRILERSESGVLFAEGPTESERSGVASRGGGRKDIYFKEGKLHHVASNNASELLGEYLVRRKMVAREELDFALAVLPRYGGRMGDTLISLGLVSAVDIFRSIKEQGRDRLTNLFQWTTGKVTFYVGQTAPHVEFPLDLPLVPLMLAGLEAAEPDEMPMEMFRSRLDRTVGPSPNAPARLLDYEWPPFFARVLSAAATPRPLRDVLAIAARSGQSTASEVLRVVQILLVGKLLAWV
jgi:eukaryotic-like serine/threonine-protein kinase